MNEILFFITIIVGFIGILTFYKLWGKTGLFAWIAFSTILANIECTKCIDIFGMSNGLGNIIYGTIFLATDILSEEYGGKESRKGVMIGFLTTIFFTILMQIDLLYIPNSSDFVHASMVTIFSLMPRLCAASLITFFISNNLDTYTYEFIKKRFPDDKFLWLRNNGSTLTSQLVDSFLFVIIGFYGIYDMQTIFELTISSYILKSIIALCDTPFLYLAKKINKKL